MARLLSLITVANAIGLVFSLPSFHLNNHGLDARVPVACSNALDDLSSSCWQTLKVGDYLTRWNKTTPTCDAAHGDGKGCCSPDESWANCFLRLGTGIAGYDCTSISRSPFCPVNVQKVDPNLGQDIKAQVSFVLRTIFSVRLYFGSTSDALETYESDTSYIESLLNVKTSQGSLNATNIRIAAGLGPVLLGNLSAPESPYPLESDLYNVSASFVKGLHQAPAVAQAMWSEFKGSGNSEIAFSDASDAAAVYQRGLSHVMSNLPDFVDFCDGGGWIPDITGHYLQKDRFVLPSSADIYTTSSILQQNSWHAVPGAVSSLSISAGTCQALNSSGTFCTDAQGEATFQSAVTGRSYTLKYKGRGKAPLTPASLLQDLNSHLGEQFYFTGSENLVPVMFDGAYNCTLKGNAGPSLYPASAETAVDGSLDTSCLSVLPMYLPKGSACPADAALLNGKCPFGFEG